MKTRFALLAASWLLSSVALAQAPEHPPRGPDMDRMALLLDLTAEQRVQVEKVITAQREQMRTAREQNRTSGERPSREDMKQHFEQMRQETLSQLQGVLSPLQIKKFEALMDRPPPRGPRPE
jgi:Spy/CpxP family protein refolding chaperone